jgi:rhodanese-related sulfurtransferase
MFGVGPRLTELSAQEVAAALGRGEITLVDVREPAEFTAERIAGAILRPLSQFDPSKLPRDGHKLVLHCGVGRRSAAAAAQCAKAGVAIAGHMRGGLAAWTRAGLPTVSGPVT